MNEAESSMHIFRLSDAIAALEKAVAYGFIPALGKLLRAKGWTDDWKDFEKLSYNITKMFNACVGTETAGGVIASCNVESGVEYLDPSRKCETFKLSRLQVHFMLIVFLFHFILLFTRLAVEV
jgi:hypothetical protein